MIKNTLNPHWVLGFIDAEGCFHVAIQKNATMRLGVQVQLQFSVAQHMQDEVLMQRFIPFFDGVGQVTRSGGSMYQYRIRGMDDLEFKLFPFLDAYPLLSKKSLDYANFRVVHDMMRKGLHLTPQGLETIRTIQATMNRQRVKQ
jgi:hypothetical protein